jgi:predicted signal transduction protein with EAL and GGDEF domain
MITANSGIDTAIAGSGIIAITVTGDVASKIFPADKPLAAAQKALDDANPHATGFALPNVTARVHAAVERDPSFRERTLFMTGDITTEAERIIAATNCPYLRKPFDITLAVQAIAALVGVAYQPEMGPTDELHHS